LTRTDYSKILLIESDSTIQESTSRILEKGSFQLSILSDERSALDHIQSERPDLILCDNALPGTDIKTVLSEIKTNPQTAEIPFILLTRNPNLLDLHAAITSGADNFLPIPFSQKELLHTIRTHLARYRARRQKEQDLRANICHDIATYLPHELMTPLNNILNLAELVAEEIGTLTTEDLTVIGKTLRSSSNRLLDRIRAFLLFHELHSQVLSGEDITQHYPPLEISMSRQIRVVAENIASRHTRLDDLELVLNDSTLHISPDLLNTSLNHILDNAFKFSARGSPVSIHSHVHGDAFVIEITDQGRGMSPVQIENIAPLRQFDRIKFEQQGSGLGLATVCTIQALLKGDIQMTRPPEGGLSVRLNFPLSSALQPSGI